MKMLQKMLALTAAPALLFISGSSIAYADNRGSQGNQGQDERFRAQTDSGDEAHVLPSPDVLLGPARATFAPTVAGSGVYPPSYGSGQLSDHGGPEIPTAGFYAVYWNQSVATSVSAQINTFVQNFSNVPDYTIIQQYGTANPIAAALAWQGWFVDSKSTQSNINDSSIRSWLAGLFNSGKVPVGANTIYGLYFPANMRISLNVFQRSCTSFCGYHGSFSYSGKTIKYAVFPYPNCSGCSISGLTAIDMLTIVSSHEIREAVTDPQGNAWYDSTGYEADDKCVWHNLYKMANGGAWVQPEYSNKDNGCVVP